MKIKKRLISALMLISVFFNILPAINSAEAFAYGGREIKQVTISFSMPPVQAADVSALSVSTSTGGCYIKSAGWYDIYGQPITNKFTNQNATIELVVVASTGYYFPGDVAVTVGGEPAARENYGSELHISKSFSPVIWAPTMVKHPGDETVEEGGIASFISYASCTDKSSWQILDTNNTVYSAEDFAEKFPDLFVDISFEKLNISPVPMELNGYKVRCCLTGPGGDVNSNYALLTVEEKQYEAPPVEEGALQQGEAPVPTPVPTPEHQHTFNTDLMQDAGYHWYGCDCGETLNKEEHSFVWVQKKPATMDARGIVSGECRVCGFAVTCETELDPEEVAEIKAEETNKESPMPEKEELIIPEEDTEKGFFKKIFSLFRKNKNN